MDFLKFAIAGELLVVSSCNLYQTILCQVDYRSRILDQDSGSRTYIVLNLKTRYMLCVGLVIFHCELLL